MPKKILKKCNMSSNSLKTLRGEIKRGFGRNIEVKNDAIKTEIIDQLLTYSLILFQSCYPSKLNLYQTSGIEWHESYNDLTTTVLISDILSKGADIVTAISSICSSFFSEAIGDNPSDQLDHMVSLFYAMVSGYETLEELYNTIEVSEICNILLDNGLIVSCEYYSVDFSLYP